MNENKTSNWKSFIAFFLFIIVYGYAAFSGKDADVIFNTGLFAFLAMALIMSRSGLSSQFVSTMIELVKSRSK